MRVHITIAAVLLAVVVRPVGAAGVPLATGRFEYALSWNGIPAGRATVDVQSLDAQPTPTVRVDATARTNRVVDLFWRLRAHAAGTFTRGDLAPLGFRYDREVNRERSLTEVTFTARPFGATGTRYRRGRAQTLAVDDPGVLDPITAIFHALSQPLQVGKSLTYSVFTGEARYRVEVAIVGEETVRVTAGTFRAWRGEPRIWKIGTGLDHRLRRATLWVSQAPVHALLRIRSEVFIGAVTGDLQQMLPAGGAPSAAEPGAGALSRSYPQAPIDYHAATITHEVAAGPVPADLQRQAATGAATTPPGAQRHSEHSPPSMPGL